MIIPKKTLSTLVLFALALGCLYQVSLAWLVSQWLTDKVYSHGFLIPLISIYLVWLKRDFLPNIKICPAHIIGSICILFSLIMLFIGRVGVFVQLEAISLLLILPSIVLFLLGWDYLKALALPLFYLQFMVPWLDPLIDKIHLPFQLITAELAAFFLKLIGYPVFQDKVYIHLPNIALEVARECSGISFLITVIAIGLALVYLTQKTWKRAVLVLLSGVFVVILANGIRVAIAGVLGQCYGPGMLHGPGHIFQGWFVAQVGLVGIFIVNWWVAKRESPIETRLFERASLIIQTDNSNGPQQSVSTRATLALLSTLVVFCGYLYLFATPKAVSPGAPLPYRVGSWYGHDDPWLEGESYSPGALQMSRTYRNPEGREVKLFISYYAQQSVEHRLISYQSRPLYNQGNTFDTGLKRPVRVEHAVAEIDHVDYETLFWFRLPSGDYTASSEVKIRSIRDALFRRQNYGAFILLASPATGQSGEHGALKSDLLAFLQALAPEIDAYLP